MSRSRPLAQLPKLAGALRIALAFVVLRVGEKRGGREDHRHRIRDVLALERWRRPVCCLGHERARLVDPVLAPLGPGRRRVDDVAGDDGPVGPALVAR